MLLADASGATWKLQGKPDDDAKLVPYRATAPFPILALAEAPDQSLILAGSGGVLRVPGPVVPTPTSPAPMAPAPAPVSAAPAPVPTAPAPADPAPPATPPH
ncbi:MAG: hypothetical protein ACRYFY_16310 [Janthinobacterium lividum]